jgi:hypothetical protein
VNNRGTDLISKVYPDCSRFENFCEFGNFVADIKRFYELQQITEHLTLYDFGVEEGRCQKS